MNLPLWATTKFYEKSFPPWPCPLCSTGILEKEKFHKEETIPSLKEHNLEGWDPNLVVYGFSAFLRCNYIKCNNFVMVVGEGSVNEMSISNHGDTDYFDLFTPKYFYPPLHLFTIPANCPPKVTNEIVNAFGLYWCDLASAANKIRVSIEHLMDFLRIKKWDKINTSSSKEKPIPLHKRIELYSKTEPEIAKHLLAIKWIGNAGTHTGKLNTKDVLTGFELLEYCVEELFNNKARRLTQLSEKINKRRGPKSQ